MTNLDSRLKSRDITFSTKVRLVKAMIFPVVMYGYKSWTVKKVEHQRIYFKGSNGETDIKNRRMDMGVGEDS